MRAALGLAAAVLLASSSPPVTAGEDAETTYRMRCAVCHGTGGEGERATNAPPLAGLDAAYLKRQLEGFRRGWRGTAPGDRYGAPMRAVALALPSGRAEDALVTWLAGRPAVMPKGETSGDARAGESTFTTCGACHGLRAQGNPELHAPRLTGLPDWYAARQLEYFRSGVRGADEADEAGFQMATMAALLPDEQAIHDVLAYVRTLAPTAASED